MQKFLRKYLPIFVIPTFIAFLISFLIPFLMGIYLSFTQFTTVTNAKFIGFGNYITAFSNQDFMNALWFTVKFTVISTVTINVFAFALAILLTKGLKGTNFFRTVFFMPNLIGGIILGYIWQIIINSFLGLAGVDITYAAKYGFWGLVLLMNWQLVGYMMVIYIAGIQNIPEQLNEAAAIDGANSSQKLFRITIPMVMPSIAICTFLTITNSFKLFDQNLALTGGAPGKETDMLALDIYKTFYSRNGFEGVGQAKAVVFFILVAIIALIQLKLTTRKEMDE